MRRSRVAFGVLVTLATVVASACGGTDATSADGSSTSVPTATTSTSTIPAKAAEEADPSSTEPKSDPPDVGRRAVDAGDYEGQLYDFGAITDVHREGSAVVVVFNRQQLYTEGGKLQSGSQFTQEPIVYGNTDVPYIDDSPKTRRFVMAPSALVLRIADPIPCASDEIIKDPVWSTIGVDKLVAGAWSDRLLDSLSFRADGLVDQVRLSSGC